uniref:CapA family protein n=1 Tax=candidate division WOR-3 bacterium TaxID=2052148 RepID=A0A7C4Y5I9_UNCW3
MFDMLLLIIIHDITFTGVGDIMLGNAHNGVLPDKRIFLFENCKKFFRDIDIVFGNLEGPITDYNIPEKDEDKKNRYAFRMPERLGKQLKDAGFNVLSIVNNHIFDFGLKGYNDTKRILDSLGIKYASCDDIARFKINGKKICLTGFSFSNKKSFLNLEVSLNEIKLLSDSFDIVIVSIHGGKEGKDAIRTKNDMEYFLGEKRGNLVQFSHLAIENGADLVIIHGPHVPRGLEIYKNRLIAYSLGNFCTYGGIDVSGISGLAPLLIVRLKDDGEFISGRVISFKQEYLKPPYLDKDNGALNLIKKLSLEDFPSTSPFFEGDSFLKREENGNR